MNMHKNSRLTIKGRLTRGEYPADVASALGVSVRTVYKWRQRYRECGETASATRHKRPCCSARSMKSRNVR